MQVKVDREDLTPARAHPTDAGLDLKCKEDTYLVVGERKLVGTGVSVKIPVNHVGILVPRSSLSKSNITMTNSVGIIDSDYRGEIMASLMYHGGSGGNVHMITKGERFVQLLVVPISLPELTVISSDEVVEELWFDTARGSGGFGSTGKK